MMNQNEEKLLKVIQEREKTFRERLDCLGADDQMTHDAFSELMGLEEAFEVVFGRTVVDYILMKDSEKKEEKNMKKLYMVYTNAKLEMIFVDYDEKIVRIYGGQDGWQYDHTLFDVEDVSSWDDDFDFDEIVKALESNSPDFQILYERDFE